jgi:hypothetical protein
MESATRELVWRRAGGRREYCLLRQEHSQLTHHVEHVVAKQHGGSDDADIWPWHATAAISRKARI